MSNKPKSGVNQNPVTPVGGAAGSGGGGGGGGGPGAVLGAVGLAAAIALVGKRSWTALTTSAEDKEILRLQAENRNLQAEAEKQRLEDEKKNNKDMELHRAKSENDRLSAAKLANDNARASAATAKQKQIDNEKAQKEKEKRRAEQLVHNKKLVDDVAPIDFTGRQGYASLAAAGAVVKPLLNSPQAAALQCRTTFELLMNALQDIGTGVAHGTNIDAEFISDKVLDVKISSMKDQTVLQVIDTIVANAPPNTVAKDYRYNLEVLALEALKLGMETRRLSTEPLLNASTYAQLAP